MRYALLCALLMPLGYAADVCNPATFPGAYGSILSGNTTISGDSLPSASVARLVFDSSGKVSGTTSANFSGYFLGNPVSGDYTVKDDCSLDWRLQDEYGGFQHFAGKLSLDGKRVAFSQTDPGGPQHGVMIRSSESCLSSDFRGRYRIAFNGFIVDLDTGYPTGRISMSGILEADGNTGLRFTSDRASSQIKEASYQLEGDCVVHMQFPLDGQTLNFRAVIVNDGKEILGIQSDLTAVVTIRIKAEEGSSAPVSEKSLASGVK
uniref:Lipoprotein n=1 Tax=Solibacter usitatus (strain Ellin6076) TaxID=234267 RepID=Q025Y9_SOLUE